MATKTYTWASWTTGWENLVDAGNSANLIYTSGSTSAKFTQTAKNATSTEYARKSGAGDSWATIFDIDNHNTVSQVRITGWTKRVVTNTKLTSHTITMKFIDDAAGTAATMISASAMATATDANFVSKGASALVSVDASDTSGSSPVRLSLEYTTVVSNSSGNSAIDTRFDDIAIEITYALTFALDTVNDSTHATTCDNVVLTASNPVDAIPNDSVQAQTAGNVVLTQHYILIVSTATQAQVSDDAVITYNPPHYNISTVNDAQHKTVSTLVDLIENYDVPPNDVIQLQTSGNVALTQHYGALTVGSATQLHSADKPALAQDYILTLVNSTTQLQSSGNVALIQNYILVVFIATQLLNSSNVSLGVGGNIIPKVMHYIRLRSK